MAAESAMALVYSLLVGKEGAEGRGSPFYLWERVAGLEKPDRKWMKRKVDILGLYRRKLKSVCRADVRNSE